MFFPSWNLTKSPKMQLSAECFNVAIWFLYRRRPACILQKVDYSSSIWKITKVTSYWRKIRDKRNLPAIPWYNFPFIFLLKIFFLLSLKLFAPISMAYIEYFVFLISNSPNFWFQNVFHKIHKVSFLNSFGKLTILFPNGFYHSWWSYWCNHLVVWFQCLIRMEVKALCFPQITQK